jgi:glycosyltransferase involved in cell wall biosynthesis
MEIAVDYSWLGPTGIGRVAAEVISRAPTNWDVMGIREQRQNAAPLTPVDVWRALRRTNADIFWSPGFMPPLFKTEIPVVLTVHDLTHLHYYGTAKRLYYEALIKPLLHRVDHIVTVSQFTRNELLDWSGIEKNKVTFIPNAVSRAFTPEGAKIQVGRKFILYVGNRRPYKNVPILMRAFAASGLSKKGYMLGLTGNRTPEFDQIANAYGIAEDVCYFGFVSDEALPQLYRSAHAVAFVSLYEGFGLPILEAMSSGVPVLTSNVSSMPEVAGDAALLVDPHSLNSISAGLIEVTENQTLRDNLIAAGLVRAEMFSWDMTADMYWELFSHLINMRE